MSRTKTNCIVFFPRLYTPVLTDGRLTTYRMVVGVETIILTSIKNYGQKMNEKQLLIVIITMVGSI